MRPLEREATIYPEQIVSAIVQDDILKDEQLLVDTITEIQLKASERAIEAQTALNESLARVENVRDFVSSPEHILGPMGTKHGEIAEHIEVEIGNAKRIMSGLDPNRTFDGVGRTAPEDYLIDGIQVQSKFINGANKNLDEILDHLSTYPDFAKNGGYYHIPKDYYETIRKILSGQTEGINSRTVRKCLEAVETIEKVTGKKFSELVFPGISTYKEVQLGAVDKTLDGYEQEFKEQHAQKNAQIQEEKRQQTDEASHITDPSWGKAAKAGLVSAVISGATMAGIKVYRKTKGGKKITEFSIDDWKEVGYDFGKGGVKGGVSGISIYWLTAKRVFSAPFAGAVVSDTIGVASLYKDYKSGKISLLDFSESANALTVEAGIAAVGAAVGQAVIPIPIIGALVGSVVSKAALEITKKVVGNDEEKLIKSMEAEFRERVSKLNNECLRILSDVNSFFDSLGGFIEAALSPNAQACLYGSIELCRDLGVPESLILHSTSDLDDFMLS